MSGIFGIYHRNDQLVDIETLGRMDKSLSHRGPDGSDFWYDKAIGFGHRMFQTTPESLDEKLPYYDQRIGLVITADARLDNRDDLVHLLKPVVQFKDKIPDSLIILAAYRKWGEKCVNYLIGDFAFVIWDKRKGQMFCARDHLGTKPFYYYLSDHTFIFASEARAILKVQQVSFHINEGRIADYLIPQLEGIDKTSTFYEEISRLPPAHTMTVSKDKMLTTLYWKLDPEYETRFTSDNDYIDAFREIFKDAVNSRMRCNGRPALMLSGGIDSSSIVGMAYQQLGSAGMESIPVFSAVSESDTKCSETRYINQVSSFLDIKPITVSATDIPEFEKEIESVIDLLGEPFDAMTLIMLIYLTVRKNNSKVVLDGVEGDMIHSLSPYYPSFLLRQGQWQKAIPETVGIWNNLYNRKIPMMDVLSEALRPALVTSTMRHWKQQLFSEATQRKLLDGTAINSHFADKTNIKSRLERLKSQGFYGQCKTLRETHILNVTHSSLTAAIERYDRLAAVCSIEPRHPFFDKRLVEYSVSLPWDQKVRHGWSKFLLRRACISQLPYEVVWRKEWAHIGRPLSSTLIQNMFSKIINFMKIQRKLFDQYVDLKFFDYIDNPVVPASNSDEELNILDIFLLAKWLYHSEHR